MKRKSIFVIAAVLAISVLNFASTRPKPQSTGRSSDLYQKLNTLQEIIGLVNENYVDPVDWNEVMIGAYEGLLEGLDPHSNYIPKEQFESMNEQFVGKFQGIGIEFDIIDDWITVIAPVAGSPSERVGLRPGDKIVEIDGESAYGFSQMQVIESLRGPKGTSVNIKVGRPGQEHYLPFTIVRDDIPIYSVPTSMMLEEGTGYILISRFSSTTDIEVEAALDKLEAAGMSRLLLDLRNNGGGYLEQAVEIVDLFIGVEDTLVFTKGRQPSINRVHLAHRSGTHPPYPIIILINRGSASASEIVAGAIQDLDRGLIVGETSFGKGLVQRQWRLSDGSALRVTVGRYYTPSGRLIQRPYDDGKVKYYRDNLLRSSDPHVQDSILATLPRYRTRAGRVVYGGGGILPDVYIPLERDWSEQTLKLLYHPDRLLYQYAEVAAAEINGRYPDVEAFLESYRIGSDERDRLAKWLESQGVELDAGTFEKDWDDISNQVTREIAGLIWNRQAFYRVWLDQDPQVREALTLFDQAQKLIAKH